MAGCPHHPSRPYRLSTRDRGSPQAGRRRAGRAVVQQHDTGEVLMVGWMDDEALHRTLTTGRVTYWSRSRGEYWRKGDTSGHVQRVRSVAAGLRRRRPAGEGRPGRRGLPHRRPYLLRRRRAAVRGRNAVRGLTRSSTSGDTLTLAFGLIWPDPSESLAVLARDRRVIPVMRRFMADAETPVGVYRKLAATGRAPSCSSPPSTAGCGRAARSWVLPSLPSLTERARAGGLDRPAPRRRADLR